MRSILRLAIVLVALVAGLLAMGTTATAADAANSGRIATTATTELNQQSTVVLRLVNKARSKSRRCGGKLYRAAKPLRPSTALGAVATAYAAELGTENFFAHVGLDGSTPTTRAREFGYRGPVGENIAAGFADAKAAVAGWLASPGHCMNIMEPNYKVMGVGVADVSDSDYGRYWVQNFGFKA